MSINLKPYEVRMQILQHPKLVRRMMPHFTVITRQLPIYQDIAVVDIRNMIKKALASLQGRMFCGLDHHNNLLILGFEEPADATFFELMSDGNEF